MVLHFTEFNAELVPDNLDTIIIGSGISSLAAAVLLGRVGQKVLVLEQHNQAGGSMHTFKRKGYEFDTGREKCSVVAYFKIERILNEHHLNLFGQF